MITGLFKNPQYVDIRDSRNTNVDASKIEGAKNYAQYMLLRTIEMFEYGDLPDTIPGYILELMLQCNGYVIITDKYDGNLYAYSAGLGGEPDEYYRPTIATVANPAQDFSRNLKIGVDCEIMLNDSLAMGMLPMYNRYASMIMETDITLLMESINNRATSVISSSDDSGKASADLFMSGLFDGKLYSVINKSFGDNGIEVTPYTPSNGGKISESVELRQYLMGQWFCDVGLSANFNMKKENISEKESQVNDDTLTPLIDNMLACREEALERINALYGTNITVKLSGAWERRKIIDESEVSAAENEMEDVSRETLDEVQEGGDVENEDGTDIEEDDDDTD